MIGVNDRVAAAIEDVKDARLKLHRAEQELLQLRTFGVGPIRISIGWPNSDSAGGVESRFRIDHYPVPPYVEAQFRVFTYGDVVQLQHDVIVNGAIRQTAERLTYSREFYDRQLAKLDEARW